MSSRDNSRFHYNLPSSNLTVDEMMIHFGDHSHHTYQMPSKPIKKGYKVFTSCDVGYTYNWMVASESESFADLILQEGVTLTGSTVFQLVDVLPYTTASTLIAKWMIISRLLLFLRGSGR